MRVARKTCIDVFNAEMVLGARFMGQYEFPMLEKSNSVPQNLVPFNKRSKAGAANWVHFYIHDHKFAGLWRNHKRCLKDFQRVAGVILPDFSLYRDMPLALQIWNVYKSRAVGYWLQSKGVKIIPNLRWGDERTYDFAFDGIPAGGTVAVGSHGCIKERTDREYFLQGFDKMISRLRPETVVVYGRIPKEIDVEGLRDLVQIMRFDSEFHESHNHAEGNAAESVA
jgi:hypothetical protein